jgi:phosphoglycolate phosphatase-like HAD superfamily hydrolase
MPTESALFFDLDCTRVHKADLLARALEQTGVDASCALMIGDRSHDVNGAKAAARDLGCYPQRSDCRARR